VKQRIVLAAVALVLHSALAGGSSPSVAVRMLRRVAIAPADLTVYVTVERHNTNRYLKVSADSPNFFRSSEVPLNGDQGAVVSVFNFRQLPSGVYEIQAELIGEGGHTTNMARCEAIVM